MLLGERTQAPWSNRQDRSRCAPRSPARWRPDTVNNRTRRVQKVNGSKMTPQTDISELEYHRDIAFIDLKETCAAHILSAQRSNTTEIRRKEALRLQDGDMRTVRRSPRGSSLPSAQVPIAAPGVQERTLPPLTAAATRSTAEFSSRER